ncbi:MULTISPECIES: hypothetical protein [unclassified Methanobrevibacter]|jgi:5-methylcytosine-specific restriction protein B|uniref:hypothetical protein n=1 Tax=unclassified Methanobrevibacter TaxID=2638681 RepID=UPI0039B8DF23
MLTNINQYNYATCFIKDYINENNLKYICPLKIKEVYNDFQNKFSPYILKNLRDDEILDYLFLHDFDKDNLAYILENFETNFTGALGLSSPYKYRLFKKNNQWVWGATSKHLEKLSTDDAIIKAKLIRDALIKGADLIQSTTLISSEDYINLEKALVNIFNDSKVSPTSSWVHKYYHLIFPKKFINFHSLTWRSYILNNLNILPSSNFYGCDGQVFSIIHGADLNLYSFNMVFNQMISENILPLNKSKGKDFNVWLLSPEDNLDLWSEFKLNNFISIGFSKLGNLNNFENIHEIRYELDENYPGSLNQINNSKALCDFLKQMSIGDYVFIRIGGDKLLGLGRIVSDYKFSEDFNHYRDVEWLKIDDIVVGDPLAPFLPLILTKITNINKNRFRGHDFYKALGEKLGYELE